MEPARQQECSHYAKRAEKTNGSNKIEILLHKFGAVLPEQHGATAKMRERESVQKSA